LPVLLVEETKTEAPAGDKKGKSIMKKLFALMAAVTLFSGISIALGASPLEGNWGMQQQQNGFVFDMTISIQSDSVTLTNVCSFQGRTATARVTTPAQYDDHTFTVLTGAHDEESNDGLNCNADLSPDTMNYVVQGNTLIFSKDGQPGQMVLNRK
jgi:hypothetical protein